ncbi:PQQ-binding-like beta-propeller repeat protein [Novipirellula sp.]|uniref:outer membrane protein assembly factor BamB family protein n=1 Tax=Novipirellula sp. TaxID=2795430 RepID=UPI003567E212
MLANELIDRLERGGLLDQEIIEALREQLEQGTRVTPEAVAKLLVDNGQLTRFQATKLIGELRSAEYAQPGDEVADVAVMDDLAILPEEEGEEVFEVAAEDDGSGELVAEAVPVEAVAVEAVPVTENGQGNGAAASRPKRTRPKPPEHKSVWDSFKIYGFAGIIVLLLLSGYGLFYMLTRQSADEFIANANKLYDQQQFTPAQDSYISFLDSFGENHQYSSIARVRIVMSKFYRAKEMTDPTEALELLKKELPAIENEQGLNEERTNLAALLVDVAYEIGRVANKEKETTEKEKLLGKLDEQLTLTENPNYMSSAMKTTLGGKLQEISEMRQRVRREINRNVRLDESVLAMDAFLKDKKTKEAYDVRTQLLREFPELYENERLMSLIVTASDIQKTLVKPASDVPKLADAKEQNANDRSIVLTAMEGRKAVDLIGEILYLRAGGSMLAFAGDTGGLLWRKFVGYGQDHLPVRLDDGSGVLLSESAKLEVQRCDGKDGILRWRSVIDEFFSEPVTVADEVYVSTESGRLASLDVDSGEANWVAQIPQPLEVGPGIDKRAKVAYVPGNHSNLYVLNSRDGSCYETFYIGHAEGTVAVPPVALLGHVFVLENAGTDYTRVHILKVNEQGQALKVAQPSIRLDGNVKVKPIIQDRKLIVLTDLGQVSVLEVEPTAKREQVSEVARQVASYDVPTSTQMAVGRSQMWITGTRIGRYELQINTGRVVQDWFKHEADRFIGQPFTSENTLVHARILRGTSAIRVTAADAKTGDEIWRTDVGVPIAMIVPIAGGGGFHAVTTQGALFELDRDALASGSTANPVENPGGSGIAMRFENPIKIDETRRLMLNQATSEDVIVYDPTRRQEKLRKLQLALSGKASGGALFAGGGLFVPTASGRAVLMNWQTGQMLGSPFQPASAPEGSVTWSNPVAMPDDPDQVVIADSRKQLYRLRVGEQIRELAKKALEAPFLGSTAAVGSNLMASVAGPAADFVVGHDLTSLDEKFKVLLNGRINWGPVIAGDSSEYGLLRTDDSVLRAFDADGKQKFELPVPEGEIVGATVLSGNVLLVAGKDGWMVTVDSVSGEFLGQSDLGQPIFASPLSVGKNLLVPGAEGVVYITDVPSKS